MVETLKNSNALSASISARIRSISGLYERGQVRTSIPRFVAKIILDRDFRRRSGWIGAVRSRTFYRSPQRSPEKPDPSWRLDRDGK